MEAACTSSLQCCSWIAPQKIRQKPSCFVQLPQIWGEDRKQRMMLNSRITKRSLRLVGFEINCCHRNSKDSALESGTTPTCVEEPKILKKKAQEVAPYLTGCCIYLVGMMASGKTTIGKTLSEVLGYSFFDSDKLAEQAVGMTSVTQIFEEYNETFFRDNESEVLRELSLMRRLVVATGGGAVTRPINWKYMKHGITVWLDVPLEALARRIAKALARLSTLSRERGHTYANADVRVSLEYIASKVGHGDVLRLTPTDIATEALVQMKNFLLRTDEDDDE